MSAFNGQGNERAVTPPDASSTRSLNIYVHVVDDHPAIREALQEVVSNEADLTWMGGSGSAEEAMEALEEGVPDVVIVDIALGDAHGLDLIRRLRSEHPEVKPLIFSVYDESLYAERSIQAGALGYVMKSESTDVVINAIRSVYRGDVFLSRRMAAKILGKVVRQQHLHITSSIDQLTDRELSVFQMLGQGLGMNEIAERLSLSRKTIETYRRRAKEKLGFNDISELIQYAVQWTYGREECES